MQLLINKSAEESQVAYIDQPHQQPAAVLIDRKHEILDPAVNDIISMRAVQKVPLRDQRYRYILKTELVPITQELLNPILIGMLYNPDERLKRELEKYYPTTKTRIIYTAEDSLKSAVNQLIKLFRQNISHVQRRELSFYCVRVIEWVLNSEDYLDRVDQALLRITGQSMKRGRGHGRR
jgi:hypothetical protein